MDYKSVVKAVNEILSQYSMPLTLRQIYYRLVSTPYMLFPNKRSSYGQLSKILVKARENEEVDDTRIEDRTREVLGGDSPFTSPDMYLQTKIASLGDNYYRRAVWQDQPQYVEVWVEKDALSRVISQISDKYRVVTAPSKGYGSYTYLKRMAIDERFSRTGKPIVVLDFRDHDPSGLQMTQDLENRLVRYADPGADITVKRIALTIEQVRQYQLEPNPVKMADPRALLYRAEYGETCWELDAVEPNELQKIVETAILAEIDMDAWRATADREAREHDELYSKLRKLAKKAKTWIEDL